MRKLSLHSRLLSKTDAEPLTDVHNFLRNLFNMLPNNNCHIKLASFKNLGYYLVSKRGAGCFLL